ncbi:sulfotransferase [Planctomycetes bacterium TBK1r]|uniref:Sulfotransferase domain protein n=1 Tax=Stieleria magnilauensis TaxID=2527963 RepID=A0ABX5XLP2_9BACT|nr:hypothetical protein TBK1r_18350 [Planctomycetes bacterium TBK1r]
MLRTFATRWLCWLLNRSVVQRGIEDVVVRSLPSPAVAPPGFLPNQRFVGKSLESRKDSPIFVTSRFRSGSTLLWRCFRESCSFTAYYEPLNERRWFDLRSRGDRVDATHRDVQDYWREYDQLASTPVPWSDRWASHELYLSPQLSHDTLDQYLRLLIDKAPGRALLQFNRIDFRLHWLRLRFPDAVLLHLVRNPRDQWLSTFLRGSPVGKTARVSGFSRFDEFYLLAWARDLRRWFPVLGEIDDMHPFELSYLVWSMSNRYGRNFADLTICYEELVSEPEQSLELVGSVCGCTGLNETGIAQTIDARRVGRWRDYADDAWFSARERRIDRLLECTVFRHGSCDFNVEVKRQCPSLSNDGSFGQSEGN